MSKFAAGLSQATGIAASVLKFIPGGQPFAAAAMAISVGAGAVAQLTAKPPKNVGTLQEYTIGADQPFPYAMGRCELSGHLCHIEEHGREREGVPNPWQTETYILSGAGPVTAIDQLYANKAPINFSGSTGWETGVFGKYLRSDTALGATPDTTGINWTANDPGAPPSFRYWSSGRRLSGFSAMQFGMLLDAEETHFRSGAAKFSAVGRWVKAYDPRLDSTVAGGSGSQRLGDESTYQYTVNGVCHALTYAYGRYQNGKLVCGGGLSVETIDIASFIDAANYADTNSWSCNGIVYENGEDGEIWNNLKLMLDTAAAWPTNDGGVLRCIQRRPVVTVDTITDADIEGPTSAEAMSSWKDGFNTVIPKYMSEANQWSYVASNAITVPTLIAAQGETRQREKKFDLVTNKDQASALGVLHVYDSVEIDPIQVTVGRRFISYKIGDALTANIQELGLSGTVIILSHKIDLETGQVLLGLKTDTTAKHAYALARTGTAPDHPTLTTNEELELAADEVLSGPLRGQAISTSHVVFSGSDAITAAQNGSNIRVTVPAHMRVYGNPREFPPVSVNAATVDVPDDGGDYWLYYDDVDLAGGAVTLVASTDSAAAVTSGQNPDRHHVGAIRAVVEETGFVATPPTVVPPRVPNSDIATTSQGLLGRDGQSVLDELAGKIDTTASDAAIAAVRSDTSALVEQSRNEIESTATTARQALAEAIGENGTSIESVTQTADGTVTRLAGLQVTEPDGSSSSVSVEAVALSLSQRTYNNEVANALAAGSITALQTVTSGSATDITELKARSTPTPNLLDNTNPTLLPTGTGVDTMGVTRSLTTSAQFALAEHPALYLEHDNQVTGEYDVLVGVVPVLPQERYALRAMCALYGPTAHIRVTWLDWDQNFMSQSIFSATSTAVGGKTGGRVLSNWETFGGFATSPDGVGFAAIFLQIQSTVGSNGAFNPIAVFQRWMLSRASDTQTDLPPYAVGSQEARAAGFTADLLTTSQAVIDTNVALAAEAGAIRTELQSADASLQSQITQNAQSVTTEQDTRTSQYNAQQSVNQAYGDRLTTTEAGITTNAVTIAANETAQTLATEQVRSTLYEGGDVIPDPGFYDNGFWNAPLTPTLAVTDPNFRASFSNAWSAFRFRRIMVLSGAFNFDSDLFRVEPPQGYRIAMQVHITGDFQGWFHPQIHMPGVSNFALKTGENVDPTLTSGDNVFTSPAGIVEKTYEVTAGFGSNNSGRQWQFRMRGDITAGYVEIAFTIQKIEKLADIDTVKRAITGPDGSIAQINTSVSTGDSNTARMTMGAVKADGVQYNVIQLETDEFIFRGASGRGFRATDQGIFSDIPFISETPDGKFWRVEGNAFGANNDLLEWRGPNLGTPAACTVDNGTFVTKTDTTVWLNGVKQGGAAIITTEAIESAGTVDDTGIGSNGNLKAVTASHSVRASRTYSSAGDTLTVGVDSYSVTEDATVSGQWRPTAGSYTSIGSEVSTGTVIRTVQPYDFETDSQWVYETYSAVAAVSGSFTGSVGTTYEVEATGSSTVPTGFGNIVRRTSISTNESE